VALRGRVRDGAAVQAITVHHEPLPSAMPAQVASAIDRYALPKDREEYRPRLSRGRVSANEAALVRITPRRYSDGTFGAFALAPDGAFAFSVPFTRGPGIYTVVVWVRESDQGDAFTASTTSIRVTDPSAQATGHRAAAAR
ncbi:MAG: hypothetical protein WA208_17925, partial [Thermoanaerobaculia bacterium]